MRSVLNIALVGNPNSGKSTVFNALTGLNQKVANFPGVTVDKKIGSAILHTSDGKKIQADFIDLPGIYSLYPKSLDEEIPFRILCDPNNELHPDAVVIVADGTKEAAARLERVLTADPAMGLFRHVDAGYDLAKKTARDRGAIKHGLPRV